jgi:hypothetical protein
MANTGLKGRVVFADTGQGISGLTVHAVDEHTLPDHDLGKTPTVDGNFQLDYGPGGYARWEGGLNPNIRVRIYGPVKRVLYDRIFENVTDNILDLQEIRIHTNNIGAQTGGDDSRAWLVTNATLNPETGDPVNLSEGNTFEPLIDGAELFPRVNDVVSIATSSINFMNLNFRIGHTLEDMRDGDFLITKFDEDFDFRDPPLDEPVEGEMIQQKMLDKVIERVAVRVIVADIALQTDDALNQVVEFFQDSEVETKVADYGIEVLHGRAVIVDGTFAFVIGSSFDQNYFSAPPHEIRDARHRGSLLHDVAAQVSGPAVVFIEETFATVWNQAERADGEPSDEIEPPARFSGTGEVGMQVLRTMPGKLFAEFFPGDEPMEQGETSILEAYQRAIARAKEFIYIEDQYFTNSAIVDALIDRMNDPSVPNLQLIIVLNINPDFFGYPRKQIKNIRQMQKKITNHQDRFKVFTLWSTQFSDEPDRAQKPFEIMNIDVHSKVAIIDDKWATVGTANLDGSGMNAIEISDVVAAALLALPSTLLGGGVLGVILWVLLSFAFPVVLAVIVIGVLVQVVLAVFLYTVDDSEEVIALIKEAIKTLRSNTQHANPFQNEQPARHVELNLVLYNKVAGLPETPAIKDFRERLWAEHLGIPRPSFPTQPDGGSWVRMWADKALKKLENIKVLAGLPPGGIGPLDPQTVLEWKPETSSKAYLGAHEIEVDNPNINLTIRTSADKFDFVEGQWKPNET